MNQTACAELQIHDILSLAVRRSEEDEAQHSMEEDESMVRVFDFGRLRSTMNGHGRFAGMTVFLSG